MRIEYDKHALTRLYKRSYEIGLDLEEAFKRLEETVQRGILSCSKYSKQNLVYYKYFHDNISFFVICDKIPKGLIVQTIIMKRGRE